MTIKYYKVGGAVRDEILGVRSKDIDFAVEADSYEEMRDDLLSKGSIIWQERPEFFAIRAKHPDFGPVDFTLCRKEGFYSDNRHPDSVEIGTIYDDLARRDFTVNAIALDFTETSSTTLIDPHGGVIDISKNLLRCVGSPEERFTEDPLRILRAVRFHIVRGFDLDFDLEVSLSSFPLIDGLKKIPLERIYEELNKCFAHDTWNTLMFLDKHEYLKDVIFLEMGLKLAPRINGD